MSLVFVLLDYICVFLYAGEIHLTPLYGILQLRPSFTYLDKADTKFKEREAANDGKLYYCVFHV